MRVRKPGGAPAWHIFSVAGATPRGDRPRDGRGPLPCRRSVASPLLAPRLREKGRIRGGGIVEPSRLVLPAGADAAPFPDQQYAAQHVRQKLELIEAEHVARRVDAMEEEGGFRELRQAMGSFDMGRPGNRNGKERAKQGRDDDSRSMEVSRRGCRRTTTARPKGAVHRGRSRPCSLTCQSCDCAPQAKSSELGTFWGPCLTAGVPRKRHARAPALHGAKQASGASFVDRGIPLPSQKLRARIFPRALLGSGHFLEARHVDADS